ncbi:MAG TPA: inositol monophosphatase family protein [Chromatiales bacterium]|nr:inositol monophosphatase family protein [Chromatiales bacterium]
MKLPSSEQVAPLVRDTARRILLPSFGRCTQKRKADGSLVTSADLAMEHTLGAALNAEWPQIAFVSEEMEEGPRARALCDTGSPYWCLDPLDGTTNYASGFPLFAVSLALVLECRVQMGIVYDPVRDELFRADRGHGTWVNRRRLDGTRRGAEGTTRIAIVDLKRLPRGLRRRLVEEAPYASQRNLGVCALEWAWIAAGRADVYLHGAQKIWDHAAGTLLLEEAGGHSATLDGAPVFDGSGAPRSVCAALSGRIFDIWQRWLRDAAGL